MKLAGKLCLCACLATLAGQAWAAFIGSSGYKAETFYANPHATEILVSFDWDTSGDLYYSTGRPDWGLGLSVYRRRGGAVSNIYTDAEAFAGSRVTAIGQRIYFNDGGTYTRWTYKYFRYDPTLPAAPEDMAVTSDLWELTTRNGADLWSAGGQNAAIYHSGLNAEGALINNPLIKLGAIGAASGPLAFDAQGNLYYAEGYDQGDPTVYRWSAAEVARATANPENTPLKPEGHVLATLATGDGASGLSVDHEGHPLISATSFTTPSELQRLLMHNGVCLGYEVLARSDARMETVRIRNGQIYVSSAAGIFMVAPEKTLHIPAQATIGGAIAEIGLNAQGQAMRLGAIGGDAAPWVVRGCDGNRLLTQCGDGGAIGIAEMNAARRITNFVVLVQSAPGWRACALDGERILAQAGNGGMIGLLHLGAGYALGKFTVIAETAPGWRACDIDGDRLLIQAEADGSIGIARLNQSGVPQTMRIVATGIPGWIAQGLAGNLLLAQAGADGMSIILELDQNEAFAGYRLVLHAFPGWSLRGLDVE